jgi:dolichol-phosphate mannosyltransferase
MKLSIVLPCYNEEENLARIPAELMPELAVLGCEYEIIVMDDGSSDRSREVAAGLNIPELKIICHGKNKGVGQAFRTAIENMNSDLAVILDADFTFHPKYIKDLLSRFNAGDVDFVGGSPRLASYGKDIPLWRTLVSMAANIVYTVLLGKSVTASSQFFRLYKTADLKSLKLETFGFDISVEILFKMLLAKKRYAEVPVPLTARIYGVSKLNYKKELLRHMRLLFKIIGWKAKTVFRV